MFRKKEKSIEAKDKTAKEEKKSGKMIFVQNYRRMMEYVRPYWFRALIAVLITIPIGAMDAVIAWALKPYMDVVLVQKSVAATSYIPLLIIIFSCLQSGMNYLATYMNTWVGRKIANDMKITLFDKLMTFDTTFYDKTNSGEVMMRFNTDVDLACNGLLSNLKLFTTRVFSSLSLIGVLFYNSWQLAIIAVVVLFGALYPLTTVRRKILGLMDKTIFSGGAVMMHYNETYNGNRIIASYNLQNYQNKRFKDTLQMVFKLGIKMVQRTGMMSPLMLFIVSLGISAVIWFGSYLIVHQQITPGNFVSFIAALIMLYTPIKSIGNNYNNVQMALLAMERVFTLLDKKPAIANKAKAIKMDGLHKGIEYKDVSFEYVEGHPVLKHINLKINKGETIAFVGNSGGGKSTIVNLLPRFYDIKSGSIKFDGIDIKNLEMDSLRENISFVFQDNFLFSGTIRENILMGKESAAEEEIQTVVRLAHLDEFLSTLEKGIDTYVGERGASLSGGQRQRVAIARAMIKNAPIVILDEATSALDNESEAIVQKALDNLMQNKTVFVIAHRLSTINNADRIAVINEGELVELGTHEQLMSIPDGNYKHLYEMQFKNQEAAV